MAQRFSDEQRARLVQLVSRALDLTEDAVESPAIIYVCLFLSLSLFL